MSSLRWADDGEEELLEALVEDSKNKKEALRQRFKHDVDEIEKILDGVDEYCQIGLVLFMVAHQKTINIYNENKEDREYSASLLMNKVMKYLHEHIKVHEWTDAIHLTCERYEHKVKGRLISQAKTRVIRSDKILSLRVLERNHMKNKKLYMERKGHPPAIDCDE